MLTGNQSKLYTIFVAGLEHVDELKGSWDY